MLLQVLQSVKGIVFYRWDIGGASYDGWVSGLRIRHWYQVSFAKGHEGKNFVGKLVDGWWDYEGKNSYSPDIPCFRFETEYGKETEVNACEIDFALTRVEEPSNFVIKTY